MMMNFMKLEVDGGAWKNVRLMMMHYNITEYF